MKFKKLISGILSAVLAVTACVMPGGAVLEMPLTEMTAEANSSLDRSDPFTWGKDNWNFKNNSNYFNSNKYSMDEKYFNAMKRQMSNKELNSVNNVLNGSWGGCVYGMCAVAMLAKAGYVPFDEYTSGASCLHDLQAPKDNSDINSIINYYHVLQVTDVIQQHYTETRNKSQEENIKNIIKKLETSSEVLVGYYKSGWGGHCAIAYDVEYGVWTWNGTRYNGKIDVFDPNYSMEYNTKACIYFNNESYSWTIPAYDNGKLGSSYNACFNMVTDDLDLINNKGYFTEPASVPTTQPTTTPTTTPATTTTTAKPATSGKCGDNVTWVLDSNGVLTISGTGVMTNFFSNTSPFCYRKDIKSVVIKDGVTNIGQYVFYDCTMLKEITIPDSVTGIGEAAFSNCTSLESVTISDSVTMIGEFAFYGCSSLKSITIPNSVMHIKVYAFSKCSSLTDITILSPQCQIYNNKYTICNGYENDDCYFNGKIHGYKNSTAQTYAEKYSYKFEAIDGETQPTTTPTTKPTTTTTTKLTTTTTTTAKTTTATTTTKPAATTTVSTTTLPIITNSFSWGRDNWNFLNTPDYFNRANYSLDKKYLDTLNAKLSNIEWDRVNDYFLGKRWTGSCYGMSALAVLSHGGLLPYNDFTGGASCLNDMDSPADNYDVYSLIIYYHCLQLRDDIQQHYKAVYERPNAENLEEIISLLKQGSSLLIGYSKEGWGGHSVMAYGIDYGSWNVGGVRCNGKIEILDPNCSMEYNEDHCIYFNSKNGFWIVPAYNNGRLSSTNGARFNQIISDKDFINKKGFLNNEDDLPLPEPEPDDPIINYYSRLEVADADDETYSVSKVKNDSGVYINQAAGEDEIIRDTFYVYSGESDGVDGYWLKGSDSAYKINQKKEVGLDLRINYKDYLIKANAAACSEVIFDPSCYASINGLGTDYGFTMVANDGFNPTDWCRIAVNGENANNVSLKKTSEGYVMNGDNLENVEVLANNYMNSAERSFTTDYKSVLIYEVDENTIGIKVDADGNGSYETELDGNSSDNDDDGSKVKVPANAVPTIYGDTNSDGAVNVADVVQLNKFLLNRKDNPIEGSSLANADCMKDGCIDSSDSTFLMNYVSMQITEDKLGA